MKKLTKLLTLSMTAGLLLIGCDDTDVIDENDLPDVEDPVDEDLEDAEEELEENLDEDIDEDIGE